MCANSTQNNLIHLLIRFYLQNLIQSYCQHKIFNLKNKMLVSNQFLESIGLTQFHFNVIVWTLVISVILVIANLVYKFGVFKQVQFQEGKKMRAFRIIYFNHRGPYEKIGTAFANAKSIFSRHFKISKMIGLYYDNPKQMDDKNMCRSSIGIVVNEGQLHKVQQFFKANPSFLTKIIPPTKFLSASFPYVNQFSFLLIVAKVYPKLVQYMKQKNIVSGGAMIQYYHLLSETGNTVEVMAPLQNFSEFNLWEDDNDLIAVRNRWKNQ